MVTNEAYFIKTNDDIGCSVSPLDLLSYARQVACGMVIGSDLNKNRKYVCTTHDLSFTGIPFQQ